MNPATLHGATYSVYTRIARLVMEQAGLPYRLVELDIFDPEAHTADYLERQPFGKIPAFEHDGFRLFETDAIARYVLDLVGSHALVPLAPQTRARMVQLQRIADNYAYPVLIWDVYVEEKEAGAAGRLAPEVVENAHRVLGVLEALWTGPFFVGPQLTLADLWLAPVLIYLRCAPTGRVLLSEFPELESWLETMETQASMQATRFPRELETAD